MCATTFQPPAGVADFVTFSYSLTMIPNWMAAIDQAAKFLRPGGTLGVVDFYVSHKYESPLRVRHGWWTRTFWPTWFAFDDVFLSPEHPAYLDRAFETVSFDEGRAALPYFPVGRAPFYRYVGLKK